MNNDNSKRIKIIIIISIILAVLIIGCVVAFIVISSTKNNSSNINSNNVSDNIENTKKEIIVYKITYDTAGATEIPTQYKQKGMDIRLANTPSKEGYNFKGWKKDDTITYNALDLYRDDADLNLVAIWEKAIKYVVTYDTNGGNPKTIDQQEKSPGESVTLAEAPTKENSVFVCWRDTYNNAFKPGYTYSIDADLTLTAEWKSSIFNILYNTDGGSSVQSQQKSLGIGIVIAEAPTKEGCTFLYWESSTKEKYYPSDIYNVDENLILTAIWSNESEKQYNALEISKMTNKERDEIIGKKVTNYISANGYSSWKIFYADQNNIALITSDYIPISILTNTHGFNKSTTINEGFNVYGSNSREQFLDRLNDKMTFMRFMDEQNNRKAKAITSRIPTIEDFCKSYNSVEHDGAVKNITYRYDESKKGYFVDSDNTFKLDEYSVYGLKNDEREKLWLLNTSSLGNNNTGYWLASPSARDTDSLLHVNYYFLGIHSMTYDNTNGLGLRPIVLLDSSTVITKHVNYGNGNITYTINY